MTPELDRPHLWRPGATASAGPSPREVRESGNAALLLLHGTGGDETSLMHLHEALAPGAPALSVRGMVLENGLNRFFRRLAEGVLDEADLTARTHELAAFLQAAQRAYGLGRFLAVGFSNGANMATALLLHHPGLLAAAVAIAAMPPYRILPSSLPPAQRRLLVVNGVADPLVSEEMTRGLVAQLDAAGAAVELLRHPGGHEVPEALLPVVSDWLR